MKKGLSLVEVLVSTMIIAVAVYGMILALGAQQLAEIRARDTKVLRQLHYQLLREVLKGQRNHDSNTAMLLTINASSLVCPQMDGAASYDVTVSTASATSLDATYNGTMSLFDSAASSKKRASSTLKFYYPYNLSAANWKSVSP